MVQNQFEDFVAMRITWPLLAPEFRGKRMRSSTRFFCSFCLFFFGCCSFDFFGLLGGRASEGSLAMVLIYGRPE